MDSSELFQIHEFSTGIRYQGTANSWVSLGFTGQYMNVTIPQIPYAVERSIANKEFAVAEGASSDEPAVIGRVVLDSKPWSVIAVVTRGRDEKGRSASLYRYFLCDGSDSLWKILTWIEDRRQNGQMSVFNPFDVKNVGQPNTWQLASKPQVPLNLFEHLLKQPAPIVIPFGQPCTALIINEMATRKAGNQPIAWAFNVEALEQPGRFQIIYPASARASDLLQRAIASSAIVLAPVVADEQAIKSAIKGLINSSTVKPEYVQSIASSLANTQIPERYWGEIFDSQGANNALKQGIYSPQMVRLMLLRAIAVPQSLPEYLTWLEKGNKQNDCHLVAAQFESELRKYFNQYPGMSQNIELKISEGFQVVLSLLLEQKISPEAVNKLIESPNGLWTKFLRQFIQDIDHDLSLMRQFASPKPNPNLPFKLTDASWQSIWQDLRVYWRQPTYPYQEKYQPLAKLFEQLDAPKISTFFYHVGYGQGQVPKELFNRMRINDLNADIYGLSVTRKYTISDFLKLIVLAIIKIGGMDMKVIFVIPIIIVTFAVGFKVGEFAQINQNSKRNSATSTVIRSAVSITPPSPTTLPQPASVSPNSGQLASEAVAMFYEEGKTFDSINRIIATFRTNDESSLANDPKEAIIKVLCQSSNCPNETLPKNVIENIIENPQDDEQEQIKQWVNAIKYYQGINHAKLKLNQKDIDGIINKDQNTYKSLKCDVAIKLGNQQIEGCDLTQNKKSTPQPPSKTESKGGKKTKK